MVGFLTMIGYFIVLDDSLQTVALLKMQGYTNREIGQKIERSVPSVERYLKLIRATWSHESSATTRPPEED